jgi:hypothetical protein
MKIFLPVRSRTDNGFRVRGTDSGGFGEDGRQRRPDRRRPLLLREVVQISGERRWSPH